MLTAAMPWGQMTLYRIIVNIEKEVGDRGYSADGPTLPGCFSNGRTVQEARRNMRASLRLHLRALRVHREPIPPSDRVVSSEVVTIGVP